MTAKEKLDLQLVLSKMIGAFLSKHEFQYKDVIIMLFSITYSWVRFCIREGVPGCKRNSRKCAKWTRMYFEEYVRYCDSNERCSMWEYADDQDGQSDVQE